MVTYSPSWDRSIKVRIPERKFKRCKRKVGGDFAFAICRKSIGERILREKLKHKFAKVVKRKNIVIIEC